MDLVAHPAQAIAGTVQVPGDKSVSHRALLLGALAEGTTDVYGFLPGHDCLATLTALEALGVDIERHGETTLHIHGRGLHGLRAPSVPLDLGNSGTAMRLMAGVLAAQPFDSELVGDASLSRRPMERVAEPLRRMGATIESTGGCPPLRISGGHTLNGIDYTVPVASAQVKSALLMAGLYARGETSIAEPAITRDHTERMLEAFGYSVRRESARVSVTGGGQLCATRIDVPGDLSSAAFFILAGCLAERGELILDNVGLNPTRAGVLKILQLMNADIEVKPALSNTGEPRGTIIVRPSRLHGSHIPADLVPLAIDEFPLVFVAAAVAEGESVIAGAQELRHKESDRIKVMVDGLHRLNIAVEERTDGAIIQGGRLAGGDIDSAGDHRVAMAFAVGAIAAAGDIRIRDADNVATSFPNFVGQAVAIGLKISTVHSVGRGTEHAIPVVAIDGPGGAGKGTISRAIAHRLGWHFLDSGVLYRLVGLAATDADVSLDDATALAAVAREMDVRFAANPDAESICLDGRDVTARVRSEASGIAASRVATQVPVRRALVQRQRGFRRAPGLVADGRDMGSTIFPDAGVKIFLTASVEERARRRYKQLKDKGIDVSLPALSKDMADRDRRDAQRSVAPLKACPDARILDTTSMGIDDVVSTVAAWVAEVYAETDR